MIKKLVFLFILTFVLFNPFAAAEENQKIEVTAEVANIRNVPGLEGEIIGKAVIGEVFQVLAVEGNWYKIEFMGETDTEKKTGYIHKSIVKIPGSVTEPVEKISEPEKTKKEKPEKLKAEKKKKKKPEKKPRKVRSAENRFTQERLFSGFYTKFGWMTSPKVEGIADKWIFDTGFDSPIGKYATWGLEFQPYFRSYSADLIDFTAYNLVANIFLNVKGGINLGVLWNKINFLTVYLGGGPGVSLGYLYTDYNGITGSQFDVMFAWHIVYGFEVGLGKMNIVVEFQSNKVINPDIDPSTQSSKYFLLGVRF